MGRGEEGKGREGRGGWVGGPLCEILNTPLNIYIIIFMINYSCTLILTQKESGLSGLIIWREKGQIGIL